MALSDSFLADYAVRKRSIRIMNPKIAMFLLIISLSILVPGCVDEREVETNNTTKPPISVATMDDLIPTDNLPIGITYLGTHEITIDSPEANATEAVYKNSEGIDFYVRVIKRESNKAAEELIDEYKSQYKNYPYDPFEEVALNNHTATQVRDKSLQGGTRVSTYTYVWNNENYVFITTSNLADNNSPTFKLAKAIGY
ncbi:hypothetical protein B6V01_003000 [Methanosarcinales archaeon ex4572_44]|nr:MAG: hypothetical protein B6V01_003000 [Methanosarcinales archaeon ex4572_44]RLG26382.1 MAG: hypothetical protein DRN85_03175 [Methanosarcinales archaeon]HHI30756.1 hypothetical protein [Candidatus Methanoperedenaceae archaeon]